VTLPTAFTYRSARSGALVAGIGAVIVIETAALHLLLRVHHPLAAWLLTVTSVSALVWIVSDYVALGRSALLLERDDVHLRIGRRYDVRLPRARIERAIRPTFRDLPTPGTNQGRDYVNMTKPATPNVLLLLREPTDVRLPAGMRRTVSRVALHLDDPDAFVAALGTHSSA
jgi:hypothetical protein